MKIKSIFFILVYFCFLNVSLSFNCLKPKISIFFSSNSNIENNILNYIYRAKKEILLSAYILSSKKIINSLISACNRNVKIKILLDGKSMIKKDYILKKISLFNIPIKLNFNYNIMHNKFLIIDNNSVETGSYNYTYSANWLNAENIIYLDCVPKIVLKYKKEFLKLWKKSLYWNNY